MEAQLKGGIKIGDKWKWGKRKGNKEEVGRWGKERMRRKQHKSTQLGFQSYFNNIQ